MGNGRTQPPASLADNFLLALAALGPQRAREALASIEGERRTSDSHNGKRPVTSRGLSSIPLPEAAGRHKKGDDSPDSSDAAGAVLPPGKDRDLSKFFHALSDETRRNILRLLEGREACAKDIGSNFALTQPTISRHLSVLEQANLVARRREGQYVFYRLAGNNLAESIKQFLLEFRQCRRQLR